MPLKYGCKMRNVAKCKLCKNVIESFHITDFVSCQCGEIAVDGGSDYMRCFAKDFNNFLRVDEQGNEIIVKVIEKEEEGNPTQLAKKPTKKELVEMLNEMIRNIENLPSYAKTAPINHYDYCSLLILLSSIFSITGEASAEDCKAESCFIKASN
jgi:hypothetical protein